MRTKKKTQYITTTTATGPLSLLEKDDIWQTERSTYDAAAAFVHEELALVDSSAPNLPRRMTKTMQESLLAMQNSITCPLCALVMVRPVSLNACGHNFCETCIDVYSENKYECPVQSCRMPMTVKTNKTACTASFRISNPVMKTAVASWSNICHTLMKAQFGWWISNDEDEENASFASAHEGHDDEQHNLE